mgnify:CR=1 FL=1
MTVIEILDAIIICTAIVIFCSIFTLAGLAGYFKRDKKKKGKGYGGW